LKAKAEDLPEQPGFPIVEIPKDPQQDNDKSDGNGVITIPSPSMPQAATPPSGSHTAVQGIEIDHQMEDNDMTIARTEPELLPILVLSPSFFPPSSPLQMTKRLLKSQTSMSTTSPNCACLPDEIAADKAAKMSPEDVADADLEAARKRCIYTRGKFCGQIHHSTTSTAASRALGSATRVWKSAR
jgi:hypothetical protein